MPFVNIKTIMGALSAAQKAELHRKVTDLLVEIEGRGNEEFRNYVIVMIEELEPQNVGMGGRQASAGFVKRVTAEGGVK